MGTNSSIARRLPGRDARHATHRARGVGRGIVVVVVIAAVAAGAAVAVVKLRASQNRHPATVTSTTVPASVTTAVAPWTLRAPIASEVVLTLTAAAPGTSAGTMLEVFGGSTTGNQPASGIFTLDVSNGALVHVANLTTVLAEATGAIVGGQAVVFGGATPTPIATVQTPPSSAGATGSSTVPTATVIGSLPQPRAGASVTTVGSTTYIVGGADGTTPDPDVLATTDGKSFSVVGALPVPVVDPAVAAVGTKLFVFGGQALSGATAGQPVASVQMVEPAKHRVRVVGRMPSALEGAAAVNLGGKVLVLGGDTSGASPSSVTSAAGASGASAAGAQTSGTVWAFDSSHNRFVTAGTLQTPVARAGVAVVGSTAWIVGGSASGRPSSEVQSLTLSSTHAG